MGYRGFLAVLAPVMLTGCVATTAASSCTVVPSDVTNAVREGVDGDLVVYDTGRALQADSGVWYVAFPVRAVGEDEQAVFAVNALTAAEGVGPVMAVDGYASAFTNWPVLDGANGTSIVRDVKRCLD